MVQQSSTVTLSSLYSSGQCLLSVLGSIGVILLFAGIPQLIYTTPVNPGSLMTFLLGAILICLMVAGNAFIGYKYRQLVRTRREESTTNGRGIQRSVSREDKPPSYDDLLAEDGMPPAYASICVGKPPKYEDLVAEVVNWPAIEKVRETFHPTLHSSASAPSGFSPELPIAAPIHRNYSQNFDTPSRTFLPRVNLGFQNSIEDLRITASRNDGCPKGTGNEGSSSERPELKRSVSYATPISNLHNSFSPSNKFKFPSLHIMNERSINVSSQDVVEATKSRSKEQQRQLQPSASLSSRTSANPLDLPGPSTSRL